jgi:hypothetical protein
MKINLTDFINTSKISPFNWGDNSKDLIMIFPEWQIRIDELKEAKCPFIEIDSVEFYFEDDEFNGLSELIIKNLNFNKEYISKYFNLDWLNNKVTFKKVLLELVKMKLKFRVEYNKVNQSPVITINENIFLGFEDLYNSGKIENSKLEKIYIKK